MSGAERDPGARAPGGAGEITQAAARPATLVECLLETAERGQGEYVFHLEEGPRHMSCAELAELALRGARWLADRGIEPGDRVGVFGPNRPEWVVSAFSIWLAGATAVPLPIPVRVRTPDLFAPAVRRALDTTDCRHVLVDPSLASLLPKDVALPWDARTGESSQVPAPPSPETAAVIQLTSGSTAAPKGALVSHAAVMAQMDFHGPLWHGRDGLRRSLNWTPYFHDLGLFFNGVISSAVWGATTHHFPTELFARDPAEWFRLLRSTEATMTAAPSSAYGAALRAAARSGDRMDLRHVDIAFFGAEAVDPGVADRMLLGSYGVRFRGTALGSSYGLAEAVLAVTVTPIGEGLRFDSVSLEALRELRAAPAAGEPARILASCGRPGQHVRLRIMGPDGELAERQVGEVQLRGASLMERYVGRDVPDPFLDGWLHTGDLGYMADGQLFITGRMKDMVIVFGRNYYPEDFEWAAGAVDGVRPGRCVAFADHMTERLVLLVEPTDERDVSEVARATRERVADAVGVFPGEVAVVPRGTVEKTTSGKLRRGFMQLAYGDGRIDVLARTGAA